MEANKTYRWVGSKKTIMDAVAAVGFGTEIDVSQFRHIGIAIIGAGSADLTIKCQGSYEPLADVDFSAAASKTNPWDYIGMYDMEDGTFKDGDTGIVFSGNDVRIFQVNTDALRSLNFHLSTRVAGNVTVYAYPVNNQ